jgi:diguanylate cyclase (GGDEF)-like protein/PAS domain S-box-containing protein
VFTFSQFKLRQKIGISFGVLIAMIIVNALVVGLATHAIVEQVSHKQKVGQVFSEIDKVRLLVSRYVNNLSRSSAQQVFMSLDGVRKKISAADQEVNDEQLKAILPLLDDFRLHFQKYMVEADQKSALKSRAITQGRQMASHLAEPHAASYAQLDHRALDRVQAQVLTLQWAGQVIHSELTPSPSAQMANVKNALAQLRESSQSLGADQDFQRRVFRILRDGTAYVDSLERYLHFQELNAESERKLSGISDAIQEFSQQASRAGDQAIASHIALAIGLMVLIFLLTLLSAVILSAYLSRDILRPIKALVGVTHRLAEGDPLARASATVDDEIGELARSFNHMTENLLATQSELQDKNVALERAQQELERRVEERTLQLAGANQSLKNEISERINAQLEAIRAHQDLAEREMLLRQIMDIAPITICLLDMSGRITLANNSMAEMFGYPMEALLGMNHLALADPLETDVRRQNMLALMNGEIPVIDRDRRFLRANGERFWGHLTAKLFCDPSGQTLGLVGVIADISERKRIEEQIRNLAYYDSLTQLPNRRMLHDRLAMALANGKRNGEFGALMLLDLDNFKRINDERGHAVGDLLLIEVAHRLSAGVREVDTVARLGGDEFVIVLGRLDADAAASREQARAIAEKLLSSLARPYLLSSAQEGKSEEAIEHHCPSSIGVTLFNGQEENQNEILKRADDAMYQAKACGRNTIRFFGSEA